MKTPPLVLLARAARVLLAVFFVWAAVVKIASPDAFALAVSRYPILVGPFAVLINPVAILLPWIELASGLSLLFGPPRTRAAAALLVLAMLAVFTIAIAAMLASGQASSCGCFSLRADASSSNAWNIVRNLLLIVLASLVLAEASSADAPITRLRTKFRIPIS
ncbi:MAG: DoxX family protein [Kiritimatiellae bacterium]|nr:DoxX family protein [Kiritimatiellia bacterium]